MTEEKFVEVKAELEVFIAQVVGRWNEMTPENRGPQVAGADAGELG